MLEHLRQTGFYFGVQHLKCSVGGANLLQLGYVIDDPVLHAFIVLIQGAFVISYPMVPLIMGLSFRCLKCGYLLFDRLHTLSFEGLQIDFTAWSGCTVLESLHIMKADSCSRAVD